MSMVAATASLRRYAWNFNINLTRRSPWSWTNAPFSPRATKRQRHQWRCRCAGRTCRSKRLRIVQGSIYKDLRVRSASALKGIDFDGYAIGGLAVGEGQAAMLETLEATVP